MEYYEKHVNCGTKEENHYAFVCRGGDMPQTSSLGAALPLLSIPMYPKSLIGSTYATKKKKK